MRMFLLLFLLEMLQKYKLLPRVIILTLLLKLAKPLSRLSSCCISPLQIPICRAKPSIPYSLMKEHPYMEKLGRFTAYARTQRFARNAPYAAVFLSENPLHFAGRRDERVIVGYCTSAEVPFLRRRFAPLGRTLPAQARNPLSRASCTIGRSPLKKGVAA